MTHISISERAVRLLILEDQIETAVRKERQLSRDIRDLCIRRDAARAHADNCRKAIKAIAGEMAR